MVLNVLLGVIALAALGVALGQLRLQRTAAGGRGILLIAGRTGTQIVRRGKVTDCYRVEVKLAGPGGWHELAVDLEKDGRKFHGPERPPLRKRMTCESEPIKWEFELSPQDGDNVWCLVSWAEPRGSVLRTEAFCIALRGGPIYEWKWFPGHRYIGLLSEFAARRGPNWFRKRLGRRPQPLGRWRKRRAAPLRAGNGPRGLGTAPDGRRRKITAGR
jgi:hypothetical protein